MRVPRIQHGGRQRPHKRKEYTMAKTDIKVKIIGADSNIFNLLGICRRTLQTAKRMDLWEEFYAEATSGDYNHALATIAEYFEIGSTTED